MQEAKSLPKILYWRQKEMNQNLCQRLLFVMLLNKLRIRRSEQVKIYGKTDLGRFPRHSKSGLATPGWPCEEGRKGISFSGEGVDRIWAIALK